MQQLATAISGELQDIFVANNRPHYTVILFYLIIRKHVKYYKDNKI